MYDVVSVGEYLIDFTPNGRGAMGNPSYEMNPGGAPANCLASCSRLGGKTAMIAGIGNDMFGRFLRKKLEEQGIDDRGLQTKESANTTLVYVSLTENGEREFAFVRNPGADTMITADPISEELTDKTKVFHFGSLSLTDEPARETTIELVKKAKSKGKTISFDPNYREVLWQTKEEAVTQILKGLELADSVKMSEEELELITGIPGEEAEKGIRRLLKGGAKRVYITMGSKGAWYGSEEEIGFEKAFPVQAVDTTGCGDAFTGAILYMDTCRPELPMREKVRFANAVGALCALKYGGMTAMPSMEEVIAAYPEII